MKVSMLLLAVLLAGCANNLSGAAANDAIVQCENRGGLVMVEPGMFDALSAEGTLDYSATCADGVTISGTATGESQ